MYNRLAELVAAEPLTETGTLRLHFRVKDDGPFTFLPGQFVGIQAYLGELGYRRSPYCILSPPREEKTFELLIRIVPEGPCPGTSRPCNQGTSSPSAGRRVAPWSRTSRTPS